MQTFEQLESEVRSYCRSFPTTFTRASGSRLWDDQGRAYIDFFAGAGALNYGHNDARMRERVIDYLRADGIVHSLDMATEAKAEFLRRFFDVVLEPRGLEYKVMFPGPTGTNAVESALKLARKVTGRNVVVGFTNGFHGMTLGALAVTGNAFKRKGAGVPLNHGATMPFDGYAGGGMDTIDYFERLLSDAGSGLDHPAAVIVETVQGEGGLNAASTDWLRRLGALCEAHDILLIVDDIQAGCGRTGTFFSFEPAALRPDMVCLSKSIGGMGLPLALTLLKPELDQWAPGEHNGTFRGHNLAFVAGSEALRFWEDDAFARQVQDKGRKVRRALEQIAERHPEARPQLRGRGLMQGIACGVDGLADRVAQEAFRRGLILETSGPASEVVKLLPPLVIDEADLEAGLDLLAQSFAAACAASGLRARPAA